MDRSQQQFRFQKPEKKKTSNPTSCEATITYSSYKKHGGTYKSTSQLIIYIHPTNGHFYSLEAKAE